MRSFLFLFAFAVCVLAMVSANAGITCSENEEVDKCKNPCQPTCEEPNPPVCNFLLCNEGCVCKKGYILNQLTQKCVPPNKCPNGEPNCAQRQIWAPCGAEKATSCQTSTIPLPENLPCRSGCVCDKGLIWDINSKTCVKPNDCPPLCPNPNEEYSDCGSACPESCASICGASEQKFCAAVCRQGCKCKDGYVLDARGNCIPRAQCSC